MRRVRYSRTFIEQLAMLLAQGEPRFGSRVVEVKRELVYDTIDRHLAAYPKKPRDPETGLFHHAISRTPFVVLYDFDDEELRVYFVVHGRARREGIDPASARWS